MNKCKLVIVCLFTEVSLLTGVTRKGVQRKRELPVGL